MPSAYDYQSHCQRFCCTESVTRFATSFCAYLRAHALVTSEQLAHEFSLGIAIVEEQLQQLREQGAGDESATRHLGDWLDDI